MWQSSVYESITIFWKLNDICFPSLAKRGWLKWKSVINEKIAWSVVKQTNQCELKKWNDYSSKKFGKKDSATAVAPDMTPEYLRQG